MDAVELDAHASKTNTTSWRRLAPSKERVSLLARLATRRVPILADCWGQREYGEGRSAEKGFSGHRSKERPCAAFQCGASKKGQKISQGRRCSDQALRVTSGIPRNEGGDLRNSLAALHASSTRHSRSMESVHEFIGRSSLPALILAPIMARAAPHLFCRLHGVR